MSSENNTKKLNGSIDLDKDLIVNINKSPSYLVTICLILQHLISCLHANLFFSILAPNVPWIKARLVSSSLIVSGVATLLQSSLGVRLPLYQGANFIMILFVNETLHHRCGINATDIHNQSLNETNYISEECFFNFMLELQGGIILVALLKMILGATGIIGCLVYFIGPLTVTPVTLLASLSLSNVTISYCEKQWMLAVLTVLLIVIFSFVFGEVMLRLPSTKKGVCYKPLLPLFKIIPILLTFVLVWILCSVLTWTEILPENPSVDEAYFARVDAHWRSVEETTWFDIPYPGQWGTPSVTLISFIGCLAIAICCLIESIANYIIAADICQESIPIHSVNRGILLEGFHSFLAGIIGSGSLVMTYSASTGITALTKVTSRQVFYWLGLTIVIIGILTKISMLFYCIPDPILGGILVVSLALMMSFGLSLLEKIDLKSSRNLAILGFSLMIGMAIPMWAKDAPDSIFGGKTFNQGIITLARSQVFVGGSIAFLLDNLLPGSTSERGIELWRKSLHTFIENNSSQDKYFNISFFNKLNSHCFTYFPFLPYYKMKENSSSKKPSFNHKANILEHLERESVI